MMKTQGRIWTAAMLVLMTWGCSHLPLQQLIDKPKIRFESMSLEKISLFEATPVFNFSLTNPNPMGVSVQNIKYDLKINDRKFVKGVSSQNIKIPAAGSGTVALPVTFSYMDILETLNDLSHRENVRYELAGTMDIGPFSLPYQTKGTFDMPRLPEVILKDVRISNLSLTRADVAVEMEVSNNNPFTISLGGLEYALKLGGRELAAGKIRDISPVNQGGRTRLEVPVQLDLFRLGRSVYQMLNSPVSDYELSGKMLFDVPGQGRRSFSFKKNGQVSLR